MISPSMLKVAAQMLKWCSDDLAVANIKLKKINKLIKEINYKSNISFSRNDHIHYTAKTKRMLKEIEELSK